MNRPFPKLIALLMLLLLPLVSAAQEHPRLLLSAAEAKEIRAQAELPEGFAAAMKRAKRITAPYLEAIPDVPVPRDPGGGYTHERHKKNANVVLNAGLLYQLTGDEAYAALARDVLLAYAVMYQSLPEHPEKKNQAPGKLFWQSLNEAVWLLTSIQGYDAIHDGLSADEQAGIEQSLFRPMVEFLSDQAPQTFDKIHNHGTWAVAAVGMTGYVLDDSDYVEKSLLGLKKDGSAGFLRQMNELFSPDGYYSEGPYYQRYALMPFLLFAKAIERNEPEREIFQYRDGILLKAVDTTIQLSYNGYFFPINDALKDKGLDTIELCFGISIAYGLNGDPGLLGIALIQDRIVLTGDGYRMAQAIQAGKAQSFSFRSLELTDGPKADQGVLAILRPQAGADDQALVFKGTAQGMGHGHFDRLAWLFYDNGHEIIRDYGAARFLNVEEKSGGRYLPENKTWAKQTVAHNTLVVDETSHFDGDWKVGSGIYPVPLAFTSNEVYELVAATQRNAYEGVTFTRIMVSLKDQRLANPIVLDVLRVESEEDHQYDLPLYFNGQVTNVSHDLSAATDVMNSLGTDNGYQHLWLRAETGIAAGDLFQMTFLKSDRFYTSSTLAAAEGRAIFVETGANDPAFNLRREQGLILRVPNARNHTFVSVLEPHGEYNGSREFTTSSASAISGIQRLPAGNSEIIQIQLKGGESISIGIALDGNDEQIHSVELGGRTFQWQGLVGVTQD